jgi:phosphinothricin acetyltransferase
MIRPATLDDAPSICAIYNLYIATSTITFEEQPVAPDEMRQRISDVVPSLPWLVFEEAARVVGYAYASKWRARSAYRYAAESTVYLERTACGRGIGRQLYTALIAELRARGMHTVIGGALPNAASIRLHESLGFQKVAQFAEVGWKFDRWVDVAYWELKL